MDSKTLRFVTFSSKSFMPRTQVCLDSIVKYHPEAITYHVKVNSPAQPGTYIPGLPQERLKYVKMLLESSDNPVVLIGADCVLYDRLDPFTDHLGSIVLTPHVINPPDERGAALYQTGHVNADLVLFRKESLPILEWLIKQDMKNDINNGIFYEQTWMSALPFIFDGVSICRHPGINYAYFNFNERGLTKSHVNEKWYVNSYPLIMAQFSGYVEGQPELYSRYYDQRGVNTRMTLELFKDYEREINAKKQK